MYQAYKNIDRDRLEKVLTTPWRVRGQGQTFAIVLQLLGEAWLGDSGNSYLYVGESVQYTHRVAREFCAILRSEEFTVEWPVKGKLIVTSPNLVTFYFIGPHPYDIASAAHGRRYADVCIDLTDDEVERKAAWAIAELRTTHLQNYEL